MARASCAGARGIILKSSSRPRDAKPGHCPVPGHEMPRQCAGLKRNPPHGQRRPHNWIRAFFISQRAAATFLFRRCSPLLLPCACRARSNSGHPRTRPIAAPRSYQPRPPSSALIRQQLTNCRRRMAALAGRYGGDEFVICLTAPIRLKRPRSSSACRPTCMGRCTTPPFHLPCASALASPATATAWFRPTTGLPEQTRRCTP
jgi:hypothetical protein